MKRITPFITSNYSLQWMENCYWTNSAGLFSWRNLDGEIGSSWTSLLPHIHAQSRPSERKSETSSVTPTHQATKKITHIEMGGKAETHSFHKNYTQHSAIQSRGHPQLPASAWASEELDHIFSSPVLRLSLKRLAPKTPTSESQLVIRPRDPQDYRNHS